MKKDDLKTKDLIKIFDTAKTDMPILSPIIQEDLDNSKNEMEFIRKCAGDLAGIAGGIDAILEIFLLIEARELGIEVEKNMVKDLFGCMSNARFIYSELNNDPTI